MLARLKRPGYWILLLAILTVYSYQRFQSNEVQARKSSVENLYRTFGESVLSDFKGHRLLSLQSRFGEEGERNIDLEQIALFIDTLHLDRARESRWQKVQKVNGKILVSGQLQMDENLSYPIDMIVIRQGGKMLLERVKVGGRVLHPSPESFPQEFSESPPPEGFQPAASPEATGK